MKKTLLLLTFALIANLESIKANDHTGNAIIQIEIQNDSTRLAELDIYWNVLAKTVQEGDFEGYAAAYHEDAVAVFATGKNKTSVPISSALAGWKQGFMDTKAGKQIDKVEFRLSQRIGNESTAHETGIFCFTSSDSDGKLKGRYLVHFEMLLMKRDNAWYAMMEYQKSIATEEEWEALK